MKYFKLSRLPPPTASMNQEHVKQYLKSLDQDVKNIFDQANTFISFNNFEAKIPYGCFSDSTTQTLTTALTAYAITLNTDEYKNQVTHSTTSNSSRIYLDSAGVYLITYSACIESPASNQHINIWLKVGGTTIARTNTILELPIVGEGVITVTHVYKFTANQYFELWAMSDVNSMTIKATAAGATAPASPSIIVTTNKIST